MSLAEFIEAKGFPKVEGSITHCKEKVEDILQILKTQKPKHIMEIGFNAGDSADLILRNAPGATLTSFDLGVHANYVLSGKEYIDKTFPNRHTLIIGDSKNTVPEYASISNRKFDVILVDGGHEYIDAITDLTNCFRLAHPETIVILDDTMYTWDWRACFTVGPTQAWEEVSTNGMIEELVRRDYYHPFGISWGKYKF